MSANPVVRVAIACGAVALWLASAGGAEATGWAIEPTPNPPGVTRSQLISVSCAAARSCVAVGYSGNGGPGFTALAERWDGSKWSIVQIPKPDGAQVSVLSGVSCASRTACTAIGYFTNRAGVAVTLAERWDGTTWSVQRTPNPPGAAYSYLVGISCATTSSCIAVGSFSNGLGRKLMLVERWNGAAWSIRRIPSPSEATETALTGVSCSSPYACTAVGTFLDAAAVYRTLAERWNGGGWTMQPTPVSAFASDSQLAGVSCASASSCEAVGYFDSGRGPLLTLAERWDGTTWAVQPTPNPTGARTSQLFGVACLAMSACAAVGSFADGGGAFVTLAERRKHGGWAIQRPPRRAGATNAGLDAVSCPSRRSCTAVGYFVDRVGAVLTLAERYSLP
jgi:hypothetical protein